MMLGDVNELVVRYVDGEMPEEDIAQFEAMIAARPELQSLVAEHRALRSALQKAWGEGPGEADLARLHQLLEAPSPAPSRPAPSRMEQAFQRARAYWPLPAVAASLVLGVMIGQQGYLSPSPPFVHVENGQLVAAGRLDRALTGQLASQTEAAPVTVRLSFRTRGGLCRTFSMAQGSAGLACRQGSRWQVRSLIQQDAPERQGEYRLAASPVPAAIMAQVDSMIVGEPLSPQEEKGEIGRGWPQS